MRVVAGEMGGRRLAAPPGRATRPTSDRAREAIFSMLASQGGVAGADVWDLFCGSGAMGIEALSRGAAQASFVDQARAAVATTKANLAALGYGPGRATVACADVLAWAGAHGPDGAHAAHAAHAAHGPDGAHRGSGPDVVFADPPYAWDQWGSLFAVLGGLGRPGRPGPLLVAETGSELGVPPGWDVIRAKRYGGTVVVLARFARPAAEEDRTTGDRP